MNYYDAYDIVSPSHPTIMQFDEKVATSRASIVSKNSDNNLKSLDNSCFHYKTEFRS